MSHVAFHEAFDVKRVGRATDTEGLRVVLAFLSIEFAEAFARGTPPDPSALALQDNAREDLSPR